MYFFTGKSVFWRSDGPICDYNFELNNAFWTKRNCTLISNITVSISQSFFFTSISAEEGPIAFSYCFALLFSDIFFLLVGIHLDEVSLSTAENLGDKYVPDYSPKCSPSCTLEQWIYSLVTVKWFIINNEFLAKWIATSFTGAKAMDQLDYVTPIYKITICKVIQKSIIKMDFIY